MTASRMDLFSARRHALRLSLLGLLSGCSMLPEVSSPGARRDVADFAELARIQPSRFSLGAPGDALPPGWESYVLVRSKQPTLYDLIVHGNETVLRARAIGHAATGLFCRLNGWVQRSPLSVGWSWMVSGVAPQSDVSDTWADDSPGRLILAFDGDLAEFGFKDRLFFEQVRVFTGIDLPYATLIYVWDPRLPVGSVVTVPQTTRIRYLVVESGEQNVGRWTPYRRDVQQDYRLAFGAPPAGLLAVGVMTDSDDIGQSVETLYGDIALGWTADR